MVFHACTDFAPDGLQNFKDACTSSAGAPPKYALPPEVVAECVEAVLAEVTAVYHSEAKALLITARKGVGPGASNHFVTGHPPPLARGVVTDWVSKR